MFRVRTAVQFMLLKEAPDGERAIGKEAGRHAYLVRRLGISEQSFVTLTVA